MQNDINIELNINIAEKQRSQIIWENRERHLMGLDEEDEEEEASYVQLSESNNKSKEVNQFYLKIFIYIKKRLYLYIL